jgi:hypothetical protein
VENFVFFSLLQYPKESNIKKAPWMNYPVEVNFVLRGREEERGEVHFLKKNLSKFPKVKI